MAIAGLSNLLGRGLSGLVRKGVNPGRLGGIRSFISKNSGAIDKAGNITGSVLPYAPSILQGLGGDPLSGAASAGATKLAGKHSKTAEAITGLAAPLVMPTLLGGVGNVLKGGANLAGNLYGGGRKEAQREAGESPNPLGLGSTAVGFDQADLDMLGKMTQQERNQALAYLQEANKITQQNLNNQNQRFMQQVQQQGQIVGALNRQQYMAQLAGGAQQQAGETNRTVLTASNPYVGKIFG
tara:strand:+ start:697 stop:1416 length:720 start_codon:yes stop_codon:yes gene_type:complete